MYEKGLTRNEPGLIMYLVDQSESMNEPYRKNISKAQVATDLLNDSIWEIARSCQRGETFRDYCLIIVITYGGDNEVIVRKGDLISQIYAKPLRIDNVTVMMRDRTGAETQRQVKKRVWLDPKAGGGTPMTHAFRKAAELARDWRDENPNSFPPVILNITDGQPDDADEAEKAAAELCAINTSDGNLLLMTAHIAAQGNEIVFPTSQPEGNGDDIKWAQFVYRISSVVPDNLMQIAFPEKVQAGIQAKACAYNASPQTLTMLLDFGSITVRAAGAR